LSQTKKEKGILKRRQDKRRSMKRRFKDEINEDPDSASYDAGMY
jgi:hypothetical protein